MRRQNQDSSSEVYATYATQWVLALRMFCPSYMTLALPSQKGVVPPVPRLGNHGLDIFKVTDVRFFS